MNLRKWVFPASLYAAAFVILFTLSFLQGTAHDRSRSEGQWRAQQSEGVEVAAQAVNPLEATKDTPLNPSAQGAVPATQPSEFKPPTQGQILRGPGDYYSSTLQAYVYHAGVDYAEPEGAVIRVGKAGKVIYAGKDVLLGERVTLDCGDGWQVTYGGLQHITVQEGQDLRPGQALGQIGFDAGSEGQGRPQLHYEVWHNGDAVIP